MEMQIIGKWAQERAQKDMKLLPGKINCSAKFWIYILKDFFISLLTKGN